MFLNRDHEAFDESLEILCMLPEWPHASLLADLRQDLSYRRQDNVMEKLEELKAKGFELGISSASSSEPDGRLGRSAWIEQGGIEKAKEAARTYFEEVYAF